MQQARNHKADEVGASGNQAASSQVGPIIDFLDASQDPLASLLGNVGMIAQDLGHGDDRDTEVASNVLHPHRHRQFSIYMARKSKSKKSSQYGLNLLQLFWGEF